MVLLDELILSISRNAKGAFLIWGPPCSPDLNPIEKLWDVCIWGLHNRNLDALLGKLTGGPRSGNIEDLIWVLANARMTREAYKQCGFFTTS